MRSSTGIKRVAGLLMGVLLAVLSTVALSDAMVTKGSKAAGLDACVVSTTDMRRNHMDYLKHERIDVVRKGVRDNKYSIADCVDCHSAKDDHGTSVPVNAEGQFCESCHDYTAVNIACFQCHRKVPEEK
jgi:hypothetical protein